MRLLSLLTLLLPLAILIVVTAVLLTEWIFHGLPDLLRFFVGLLSALYRVAAAAVSRGRALLRSRYRVAAVLLGLFICTGVSAQGALPGVPAELQPYVPYLIGLASGFLVGPATAIYKHLGGTSGVSTVLVSTVLSALLAGLPGYLHGVYGTGWQAFWGVFWAVLTSVVKSNGSYIMKAQAARKGTREALAETGMQVSPPYLPQPL